MPICIECRHPVKTLWREGGSDKSTGHNIRLTVCKNCGQFCDKYVEHDFVVLFIDLVLIKPQVSWLMRRDVSFFSDSTSLNISLTQHNSQVYRHLLHNALMKDEDKFAVST